ncbi:hypothetical protein BGZ68_005956 [Mortierella alpina]|nr:hypothetical protein BGZ68_005956 [Mortierella alpina]
MIRRSHFQARAEPAPNSYANHRLVRMQLETKDELKKLIKVENQLHLDYLSRKILNGNTDIRVPPESFEKFKALGFPYKVLINDLQQSINAEQDENNKYQQQWQAIKKTMTGWSEEINNKSYRGSRNNATVPSADDWFAGYHSYEDHGIWLNAQIQNHPDIATGFSVGKSYQGREQAGIKIGKGPNNVVLNGLQHAREWITGPVVEYLIHELVTGTDAKVADYLKKYTFHIIPIMNPDGFILTQNGHRMHRKNAQPNPGHPECIGRDLNRNWDIHWDEGMDGRTTDVCEQVYRGTSAFSAPETANMGKYLRNTPNVVSNMDFHSHAQMWMAPHGYSCTPPESYESYLKPLAAGAVAALEKVYGTQFAYGDICNIIGQSFGNSADYALSVGVGAPFGIELRDKEASGFELPADQILPSGKEIWEAFKYVLDNLRTQ